MGGEPGERMRLKAGSQANGVWARVSVPGCRANRAGPGTSRMAELAIGNRSPLRVRLTETAGVWLTLAPALRNGSMPTNSAASATRPSALTIRRYNCLTIGPPPARRDQIPDMRMAPEPIQRCCNICLGEPFRGFLEFTES